MNYNLQYQNSIVLFIDILGFKDMVVDSEKNIDQISHIYSVLKSIKSYESSDKWNLGIVEFEEDFQKRFPSEFDIRNTIRVSSFSDLICISVVSKKDSFHGYLSTIISIASFLGNDLLQKGILIRGSITYGKIVHTSDGVVFGSALNHAYELESKKSIFPRIILSQSILSKCNYPLLSKNMRYPYHQYLVRFIDGYVGFHQLIYIQIIQSVEGVTNQDVVDMITRCKSAIISGLDKSMEDSSVFAKYDWLKNQYDELIIHDGLKPKFYDLLENYSRPNIHYQFIDDFMKDNKNDCSPEQS